MAIRGLGIPEKGFREFEFAKLTGYPTHYWHKFVTLEQNYLKSKNAIFFLRVNIFVNTLVSQNESLSILSNFWVNFGIWINFSLNSNETDWFKNKIHYF